MRGLRNLATALGAEDETPWRERALRPGVGVGLDGAGR
jgi:hypothetical protein